MDRWAFTRHLDIYPRTIVSTLDNNYGSLLDVGCGGNSPLSAACKGIPHTVGVDAHAESIRRSRSAGLHGDYVCMDILKIADHFGPARFDVVAALDVIEHLEKDEGIQLLEAMETVARRLVLVFTPNGFLPQSSFEGNPWQVHKSGWLVADFEARGYSVLGMNGWKPLRGEKWEPRIRPAALGNRLSSSTQPLVTWRPHRAFQLLALLSKSDGGRSPSSAPL